MSIIDFVFPKWCIGCRSMGAYLCDKCFSYISFREGGFCTVCQKASMDALTHPACRGRYEIDGVFASVVYSGIVKRLVYRFKYKPYMTDLKGMICDLFFEGIIQNELFVDLMKEQFVFVPIPLYRSRLRKRGYNQSKILAAGISERLRGESFVLGGGEERGPAVVEFLERGRDTRAQFGLSQKERYENLRGAFEVKKDFGDALGDNPVVFLVDDIVTSGATMREAGRALKRAGIGRVFGLAFAHGK